MALSFAFDANAGETPQTVAQRRQMANLIAARMLGTAPKNVGEGLNAIGQAVIARSMMGEADDAQKAGMASLPDFLKSQITGQPGTPSIAATPTSAPPMGNTTIPAGNTEFTNSVMPLAQQASEKTGIDPRLITAQAALESGYGKHAPGNNLFGIKSHGQSGGNVLPTTEIVNGQPVRTADSFMSYASPADSVNGYADFINKNPRYAPLKAAQGLEAQAAALGQSGYATDPNYGKKVLQIAQGLPAPTGGVLADNSPSPLDNAQYPAGPVGAPQTAAGVLPADTGDGSNAALPPNSQPAQFVVPGAQATAQPQNRFLFKNASDEDLQRALINPFTPENIRTALTQEYKMRADAAQKAADPMRRLDIQQKQLALTPLKDPYRDADGNLVQKDALGKTTVLSAADKAPTSVSEYKYYRDNFQPTPQQPQPMDYATFSTAKARASATNINNNFDPNSGQTYDKVLTEGLAKSHASLSNGVEGAQTRARDIAAMQGAIDAIQRNGGTTGGLAPAQRLELQKSINAGAAAIGISKPFNEGDLSDKEFLTKFNRSMAGAQAKDAVGSRVTNFEMSNFLKANPGLDMTIAGNQRLLGIQAQIEQRNIAVGNSIRAATADAVSSGKRINPSQVEKIIRDYDDEHHISDPATGQDLTQSYVLPEFQKQGTNAQQADRHEQNMGKVRRYNPATGRLE